MRDRDLLENWYINFDTDNEPVLVGTRDGAPFRSRPVARIELAAGIAQISDGTTIALGTPAVAIDPRAPLAVPPAAERRRLDCTLAALTRIERGDSPTDEELARAPLLDPWSVAVLGGRAVLIGVVVGHPRLPDHRWMHSSPLVWVAEDLSAARTLSRWYRLGTLEEHGFERARH